jgi:hypothetical protein
MQVQHNCTFQPPRFGIPDHISAVIKRVRCPECGQVWSIRFMAGGLSAEQRHLWLPNIRKFNWRRRARKQLL